LASINYFIVKKVREITFIKINSQRWQNTESILKDKVKKDPETLSLIYSQLSDDLAYSQTHFPNSKTSTYLNQLLLKIHQNIHISKKGNLTRIYHFFRYDYPLLIHKHNKYFIYAFLIFSCAIAIGVFSSIHDNTFVRFITGDAYVNKTIENIQNGNPLGVYASQKPLPMFFMITLNNIRVALLTFGMGITLSLGTGYLLFKNGVMLGAFQYFFHQYNLLWESATGIWMHGTIEIFSIIVAGAAGMVMGNSFLFPGTYPRLYSLQKGALDGVKLVAGLIPFFIIAGFIESYLTRHSDHGWLSMTTIGLSIIVITLYFFVYPLVLNKSLCKQPLT
jgi:uncharacterized membrane protein SpoIIM required for sporulation